MPHPLVGGPEISKPIHAGAQSLGPYSSWEQMSGYFDGDGSVGAEIVRYVLRLRIRFVDTWKQQTEAMQRFLLRSGIDNARLTKDLKGNQPSAYRVEVRVVSDVLKVAKAMRPYCVKKAEDLQIVIDYLEDRITANQAIARFNAEIKMGRRKGLVRQSDIPYTRSEGLRKWELANARKARTAYAVHVPNRVQARIRQDQILGGLGIGRLARKYGYSESVIRRVLGRR